MTTHARMLVPALAALLLAGCAAPRHRTTARGQRLERLRLGAALQLADENLREGELDRAAGLLASFEHLAEPAVLLRLARIDIEQGRYGRALKRLDTIPPARRDAQAHMLRGVALEALARPAEAAAAYAAAFRTEPTLQRLIAWSDALVLADRPAAALKVLQTHRRQFGGDASLHAAVARVHTALTQPQQAAAELRAAVLLDPDSPALERALAEALEQCGQWAEAAQHWQHLASSPRPAPTHSALLIRQARALVQAGRLRDAEAVLSRQIVAAPTDARALTLLAAVRLRLGEPAEAATLAARALRLAPTYGPAREVLETARATSLRSRPHP